MSMKKNTLSIIAILAIIGSIGLAGCGGGGGSSDIIGLPTNPTATPHEIDEEKESAKGVTIINEIRVSVGLPTLKKNIRIEKAARNHANYLTDIRNNFDSVSIGVHNEDNVSYPSKYFTGETVSVRFAFEGYDNNYTSEVVAAKENVEKSIDELMSAIYHRFAILRNSIDEIGAGISAKPNKYNGFPSDDYFCVIDFSLASQISNDYANYIDFKKKAPIIVIYPPEGSENIRRVFYRENPDPLPDTDKSGNPISLQFNSELVKSVEMIDFRLYDDEDNEVTDTRLLDKNTDVNHRFSEYQFALFPMNVLEPLTTYRVEIDYIVDGESEHKSWSFTTRKVLD